MSSEVVEMQTRRLVLAVVVVLVTFGAATVAGAAGTTPLTLHPGSASALSTADIARLSAAATRPSIIVFKNQYPNLPARGATVQPRIQSVDRDQAGVRSELAQLHSPHVRSFHIVNAVAATLSSDEISRLSTNMAVQAVVPDVRQRFAGLSPAPTPGNTAGRPSASGASQAVCPANPAVPLLEPEALETMNVEYQPGTNKPAAHDLVDGSGVRVGLIADGLDPNNPDLQRNGHSVIFDYQDFSGFGNDAPTDGREAFLDAGSIASQGNQTYDLSGFVNPAHPLSPGCNIRIKGVAPGASVAAMNVSGPAAGFFSSQVVQAIEWVVDVDHVNVLNESLGGNPLPDTRNDPIVLANNAAVAAGVTVVASSGDAGPTNTIGSPASAPGVISVGGSTTLRVYRQTTRYGTQLVPGGWLDDNITALSSAGTTEFGPRTVDVVAPGDRGWSLCSPDTTHFFGCADIDHGTNPPPIWAAGGTSASAPLTRDPNYDLEGFLVDPNGEPLDVQSTAVVDNGTELGFGPTMQFFRRAPQAGQWTLTLLVFGPIDGAHLREPFTGSISFDAPNVRSHGVPNSPFTVLRRGKSVTASIRVTNAGNINKDYFADARLDRKATLLLLGDDVNSVPLPLSTSVVPNWLVPTDTDVFTTVARGTVPILLEMQAANGDPDLLGTSLPGNAAVAQLHDPEVAPGVFFGLPEGAGPVPAGRPRPRDCQPRGPRPHEPLRPGRVERLGRRMGDRGRCERAVLADHACTGAERRHPSDDHADCAARLGRARFPRSRHVQSRVVQWR